MYKLVETNWKKVALVDMLTEPSKLFSELTKKTILKYKKTWKKILFITNRKWYASWNLCLDCWFVPKCENCDVPIAKYYKKTDWFLNEDAEFIYMCPICKKHYSSNLSCPNCWWFNIKEVGIWTYKLQEILKKEFNLEVFVVENTQVNSLNKIKKIKDQLSSSNFVISTWILSVESKYFKPDIIIFPNADTGLSVPDFNSAEKHFLSLYELIKNYSTENYIIQTYNFDNFVYQNLLHLDLEWFWKKELEFRKKLNYPPYEEIALLLYKHEIEEKLYLKISKLEKELKYLVEKNNQTISIYPTPQLVYKKFGKYHYNIILKWKKLKSFLDLIDRTLRIRNKWFQIDYLPNSLI